MGYPDHFDAKEESEFDAAEEAARKIEEVHSKNVKRQFIAIFVIVMIMGTVPLASLFQFIYLPAFEEFEISEIREVDGPFNFVVRSLPNDDGVPVGDGFIIGGTLKKSAFYPKWACSIAGIEVTQYNKIGRSGESAKIIRGDRKSGSDGSKNIGHQKFHNWFIEKSFKLARRIELVMDVRHRCLLAFKSMQRIRVDVDLDRLEAKTHPIKSLPWLN